VEGNVLGQLVSETWMMVKLFLTEHIHISGDITSFLLDVSFKHSRV